MGVVSRSKTTLWKAAQSAGPSHWMYSPANSSNHPGYETWWWSRLHTVDHPRFELTWQVYLHGTFPTSLSSASPGMAVAIMGRPDCSGKSFSKVQLHLARVLALTGVTWWRWLHLLKKIYKYLLNVLKVEVLFQLLHSKMDFSEKKICLVTNQVTPKYEFYIYLHNRIVKLA